MENQSAASRYARLASDRTIFLDTARDCAKLSLPYLLTPTTGVTNGQKLPTPWQSIGAKGCNVMASKLMLSLFPVTATFFKLQINDGKLASDPELDATIKSEIDLSLSKMERVIMQHIAESQDRVVLHQAMKHLIVTGNVLVYMGSSGVKLYPLDRYVVVRDGEGQPTEIVTVESINRQFLPEQFQKPKRTVNSVDDNTSMPAVDVTVGEDEAAVYTWAKLKDGQWRWRQEVDGEIIEDSYGKSPKSICPFLPLRFNVCDGEDYGRGRIEEYLGDLKSLEGLMQAMVEGSAAASKVVFLVSPSATVKPSILAKAGNGAIIQGRPDDVGVVTTGGKTADFQTAYQMITQLNQRLSEAFLVLTVRQSERTTAEEIRYVSQELNEQLGGIYGNLTTELLRPYLQRKLFTLQRSGVLPKLPKGVVFPTVIAGIEGIGRGQDRESLMQFMQTIAQALGPEALVKYVNPEEAIKRLAAAQGIDPVELIKTAEQRQQETQQAQQQQMQASMVQQAGQLAKAPMLDPSKNPDALEAVQNTVDGIQEQASGGAQPPA